MDLKEIRDHKSEDLVARLRDVAEESFRTRCVGERLTSQKGAAVRKLRIEAARIRTILRQRDLAASVSGELQNIDKLLAAVSGGGLNRAELSKAEKLRCSRAKLSRVKQAMELSKIK